MKRTFLVDLDVDDTDFLGVAEDLKDTINTHFPYACTGVRSWASPSAPTLVQPPPQNPPTLQP